MFKVLEGGGIKATACRTFGLNSVMYADRASDRIGGSEVVSQPVAGGLFCSSQFGRFRALIVRRPSTAFFTAPKSWRASRMVGLQTEKNHGLWLGRESLPSTGIFIR